MPESGVSIPANAALLYGIKHQVFVQTTVGTFEPREVELAYEGHKNVVVSKGLAAGEQVVSENPLLVARLWRLSQDNASLVTTSSSNPQAPAGAASKPAAK
jgi:cobalt-zinc-cadmium efflux system membrane fusion protein